MGGWWRLDKVIEPSLQLVCRRAQEVVPVAPTPIEVEAYDSDHRVSDQVTTVVTPSMRLYLSRVEARLRGITALKAMSQVR